MSEMIERVAHAVSAEMARQLGASPAPGRVWDPSSWTASGDVVNLESVARAAIEAMREPTDEMKAHEEVHWGYSCNICGGLTEGWYAMSDAALKD